MYFVLYTVMIWARVFLPLYYMMPFTTIHAHQILKELLFTATKFYILLTFYVLCFTFITWACMSYVNSFFVMQRIFLYKKHITVILTTIPLILTKCCFNIRSHVYSHIIAPKELYMETYRSFFCWILYKSIARTTGCHLSMIQCYIEVLKVFSHGQN